MPEPSVRRPYQPDLLGAPVVDLGDYRSGRLSPDQRETIRLEMRSRGVRQADLAAKIGVSRVQVCNLLADRFGLSEKPAGRLSDWIRRGET